MDRETLSWHLGNYKSHELETYWAAWKAGQGIWLLDSGASGLDDALLADEGEGSDDMARELTHHFQFGEWPHDNPDDLPDDWTLTKLVPCENCSECANTDAPAVATTQSWHDAPFGTAARMVDLCSYCAESWARTREEVRAERDTTEAQAQWESADQFIAWCKAH